MLSVTLSCVLLLIVAVLPMSAAASQQSLRESEGQSITPEIQRLLTICRDQWLRQNEPERVVQAIKRLGELRSREAIPELTKLLAFRQTLEWEDSLGPNGESTVEIHLTTTTERYPAVGA